MNLDNSASLKRPRTTDDQQQQQQQQQLQQPQASLTTQPFLHSNINESSNVSNLANQTPIQPIQQPIQLMQQQQFQQHSFISSTSFTITDRRNNSMQFDPVLSNTVSLPHQVQSSTSLSSSSSSFAMQTNDTSVTNQQQQQQQKIPQAIDEQGNYILYSIKAIDDSDTNTERLLTGEKVAATVTKDTQTN